MYKNLKIVTSIVTILITSCYLLTFQITENALDYKCLSKSHNNTVTFLDLGERQRHYYFKIVIYRWWMKMWKQSEGEVWNGSSQNILPIIFYENNRSIVQFRSDDGVLEGYLDGKSKNFALRKKGVTVRGVCLNIPGLPP